MLPGTLIDVKQTFKKR